MVALFFSVQFCQILYLVSNVLGYFICSSLLLQFLREIKGESGEWFYGSLPKKKRLPYGSTLLKKLIKRRNEFTFDSIRLIFLSNYY